MKAQDFKSNNNSLKRQRHAIKQHRQFSGKAGWVIKTRDSGTLLPGLTCDDDANEERAMDGASYTSRLLSRVVRPALGLGNSIGTRVPDDVQPVFLSQHPPDLRTQTWDPTVQLNLNCLPGDTHSLCFNVSYVTDGSVSWGTLNTGLHSKIPGTALASTFILSQVQWN